MATGPVGATVRNDLALQHRTCYVAASRGNVDAAAVRGRRLKADPLLKKKPHAEGELQRRWSRLCVFGRRGDLQHLRHRDLRGTGIEPSGAGTDERRRTRTYGTWGARHVV